jgi:hypothetical protein
MTGLNYGMLELLGVRSFHGVTLFGFWSGGYTRQDEKINAD